MNIPVCPQHFGPGNKPMALNKFNKWFCPNRSPDGEWCKHIVKAETPAAPNTAPVTTAAAPVPNTAALAFAGAVYHGTGDANGALELARAAAAVFGA